MPKKDGYDRFEENFPGSDYSADEWEFIKAVGRYQRTYGRRYPSWREVLTILKSLGYRKTDSPTPLPKPPLGSPTVDPNTPAGT